MPSDTALQRLLSPASIAVVGTSRQGGRGAGVHRNLLRFGFRGRLYGVNPKYPEVLGSPCFPRLADLPEVPDCAVIALAAAPAVHVVEECARLGIEAAIVFASGFAEAGEGGRARQLHLADVAAAAGMAVCGPNCFGVMNLHTATVAASGSVTPPLAAGGIAFVSQSGGLSLEVSTSLMERGVGFSHVISSGNEAVTTAEAYLAYLVEQPAVAMLLAIFEGMRRPQLFVRVAERAAALGKPFIVLKLGRSADGRRAVGSHTGSLAGDDRVIDAVLSTWGVTRVGTIDELIETAALFAGRAWPAAGRGVLFTSASGGRSALLADLAASHGLPLAELSLQTRERLTGLLPDFATVDNPLDMTGAIYDRDGIYDAVLQALAADGALGVLAAYQGTRDTGSGRNLQLANALAAVAGGAKPVVAFTTVASGPVDPRVLEALKQGGVPLLLGAENAVRALGAACRYAVFRERVTAREAVAEVPTAALPLLDQLRRRGTLDELAAERLLAAYGVPVARGGLATDPGQARALADELGYPVVLKGCSSSLVHKSRLGLVRVGLRDGNEVESAFRELWRAGLDGILVQALAGPGVEVIIGARGSEFGPVVVFGAGGVTTELERDVSIRLAPVGGAEARAMVAATRVGRLVSDLDGVAAAVVSVSQLAAQLGERLEELDVNPLIAGASGPVAVDAVIRARGAG